MAGAREREGTAIIKDITKQRRRENFVGVLHLSWPELPRERKNLTLRMWLAKNNLERKDGAAGRVAIAIDKDKSSQNALKWATDNILRGGQTAVLIHVKLKPPPPPTTSLLIPTMHGPFGLYFQDYQSQNQAPAGMETPADADNDDSPSTAETDSAVKDLFLSFHCFCTRKDIQCKDVVLEHVDVAKALVEYVGREAIDNLVVGATPKGGFLRFKAADIPASVLKGSPEFCNVFVISKGKVQSTRLASRPPPRSPLRDQFSNQTSLPSYSSDNAKPGSEKLPVDTPPQSKDMSEFFRSPFGRRGNNAEISLPDTDISFVSSGRSSIDRLTPPFYDNQDPGRATPPLSSSLESDLSPNSFASLQLGRRSVDSFSQLSTESGSPLAGSQSMEEVEAEMRRLKLELKQTMAMYSTACKEALTAKRTTTELQRWKVEEERRLEEARLAEEAALAVAELEKAKSRAAMEAADAARRIAKLEAQKRRNAEMEAMKESEEKRKALYALANTDIRYRKYSIGEIESATEFFSESLKIGEGGYGPVYKCFLDHTPVAIKALRPDASQGRSQFQQEVEVLSCIRHPNMVLLLGACPENGCLVYEYMENGSLEDRLFRRGNTPPLSWQTRFRIAAEIATGLLFLHQTKPEPLVHRDLKPGNILLSRNFVSKISDVGLARLVPPSVANDVTQYRMTSTAGTFCYIDPEYQQTGMLGVKSDVYSLGVMLLQMITARPPMGLTYHVGSAIETGRFTDMLDPAVPDWPVEHALTFAQLALQCSELRRKDRPDLGDEVLPELNKLREIADDTLDPSSGSSPNTSPSHSQISMQEESWEDFSGRSTESSQDSCVSRVSMKCV